MSDQPKTKDIGVIFGEMNEVGKFAYDTMVRLINPNPIGKLPTWEEQPISFRSAFVTAIISTMRKYQDKIEDAI